MTTNVCSFLNFRCGAVFALWALTAPGSQPSVVPGVFTSVLAILTLLSVDARLMAVIGHALSLHFPPLDATTAVQLHMVVGTSLWMAVAGSTALRRGSVVDGRAVTTGARVAVVVAVVVPGIYAAVRLLWAFGVPLGISEHMLREGERSGLWWLGGGLAAVAIGAAVLTVGLVRPWGERFPRWMPVLASRRVPVLLAVIPGTFAALVIVAAGIMFVRRRVIE